MAKLLIKKESLPARCEICHQKDCFDPVLNFCSRCNKVHKDRIKNNSYIDRIVYSNNPMVRMLIWPLSGMVAGIIVVFAIVLLGLLDMIFTMQNPTHTHSHEVIFTPALIIWLSFTILFSSAIFGSLVGIAIKVITSINDFIIRRAK